jgi:hypothetical protein
VTTPDDPVALALAPFWRAGASVEQALFVVPESGGPPAARLMFAPDRVLRVTDARREITYEAGRDYRVDAAGAALTLVPGSRIPFSTPSRLAQLALPRDAGHLAELVAFRFQQVEIAYAHAPGQWRGPVPALAERHLPRTLARLRAHAPLRLMVIGDSIAAGGDASAYMNLPPHLPCFADQVARGLERVGGAPVGLDNLAQPGWTARMGRELAARTRPGRRAPDLVLIAFGMNDVTAGRFDPARASLAYAGEIAATMDAIRADAREVEFILVSSMFGNPAIEHYPPALYPVWRDALLPLVGPGAALADLTGVWQALMERKHPLDMIANGLNHPNDFGHRLYAQTILGLLVEA